jgi:hypothetical protein
LVDNGLIPPGGGGDAQAASGGSQVANHGSLNAGGNGVLGDGGIAAGDGNTIAYSAGGDAAVVGSGNAAQGDGFVAGGDGYDDQAVVITDDSFNEDSNITHGDQSPVVSAVDDSEIEDVEIESDSFGGFPVL